MEQNSLTNFRKIFYKAVIIITILGSAFSIEEVSADETVSMRFNKTNGTDWGNKITGNFRVTASGSTGIISLELYFNSSLVANESSNSLKFPFDTEDYGVGMMNITLTGKDTSGNVCSAHKEYEFISSDINYILIPGVILIVILSFGVSIYQARKKKNKDRALPEQKKQDIKIKLDKDFL